MASEVCRNRKQIKHFDSVNPSDVLLAGLDVVDATFYTAEIQFDRLATMSDYAHVPGGSLKFKGAGEKYVISRMFSYHGEGN